MELYPEISISEEQAEVIARGLYAIARAEDGVHAKEAALVQNFFSEAALASGLSLASLEAAPDISAEALATALSSPELADLFIKSALLLAWADGKVGERERAVLSSYAEALEVDQAAVASLEAQVKTYLLGQLAGLANVEAAAVVAKELQL